MISKKLPPPPFAKINVWAKRSIGMDCSDFLCLYLLICEFHEALISYGDHLT